MSEHTGSTQRHSGFERLLMFRRENQSAQKQGKRRQWKGAWDQ